MKINYKQNTHHFTKNTHLNMNHLKWFIYIFYLHLIFVLISLIFFFINLKIKHRLLIIVLVLSAFHQKEVMKCYPQINDTHIRLLSMPAALFTRRDVPIFQQKKNNQKYGQNCILLHCIYPVYNLDKEPFYKFPFAATH